ncbi:MAG: hypothetical protein BWX66_00788 [Deltaproteobacteria bacterium ADurb.Bin058]|nr:MAG: hypothetical protein BWX66_00788 [Deltaproteobacteria bacterium ADurb.Bin058]
MGQIIQRIQGLLSSKQGHSTAWNDALFHRGSCRMQGVFNAGLLFLHLGLGRGTNLDDGNATCQLCQALLKLFTIIIGLGVFDLSLDLSNPALDIIGQTSTLDDGRVFFVHDNALCTAQIFQLGVLKLHPQFLADNLGTSEDGDVFQHCFAAVAKGRSLGHGGVKCATNLVDHQGSQSLAFHFLGDNHEGASPFRDLLKNRQQILHRGDFLVIHQD